MTDAPVRLEIGLPVARLILNRPERLNALNLAIWDAIPALLEQVAVDPEVKVLLVSGADARAFAAGADIAEFEQIMAAGTADDYFGRMCKATRALAAFPKPTIAVIQGPCFGGACSVALCCDFRFADDSARFGITPARLGIVYPLEDAKRLIAAVGVGAARDLLMTGRFLTHTDALELGLIDKCWPAAQLWDEAHSYAATLSSLSQFSIRATKEIFSEIVGGAAEETALSRRLFVDAFSGEDLPEGARAFIEKRKPRFTFS
jgi:enoyl-CoA hydratase/carnithine racemase